MGFPNGVLSHKFTTGVENLFLFPKFGLEGWGELDEEVDSCFQFVKDFIWPVFEFGKLNFIRLIEG